jgi:copper homeostasis protein
MTERRMAEQAVLVEVCVDSVESAVAAQEGGAGRIELCDDLVEGGTTPSAGTIAACRSRLTIPLFVMIRPRGGDFLYSDLEREVMRHDIADARRLGADGVVFGALRPDGSLDRDALRELVAASQGLGVTFHRAFDVCRDPAAALEELIELGIERVLTSGQQPKAEAGAAAIAGFVRQARGRIAILAGGGVNEENAARLVAATGVREIHLKGAVQRPSAMAFRNAAVPMGAAQVPDEFTRTVTDAARIRATVDRLRARIEP